MDEIGCGQDVSILEGKLTGHYIEGYQKQDLFTAINYCRMEAKLGLFPSCQVAHNAWDPRRLCYLEGRMPL